MRLIGIIYSCFNSFFKEDKCYILFKIKFLILFKFLDLDYRKIEVRYLMILVVEF